MSLRVRLLLLIGLLTTLPSFVALLLTRQLVDQSLELALSDETDLALEAGLRRSAESYRAERDQLQASLDRWALDDAATDLQALALRLRAQNLSGLLAGDRLLLRDGNGRELVLQPGDFAADEVEARPGGAPRRLRAERTLGTVRLVCERVVDESWRADATLLQEHLQRLRALRSERTVLERSYWLPFALLYALTLAIGLFAALWISRGLTKPVQALLSLTDDVAHGRWSARAVTAGPSEIARLAQSINHMLTTMEAQHRGLIDLEKMAGWREMARSLAHEVKNPLTPIQLTVEEMRQRYRGDDPEYRALLAECTRIVIEEVESLRNVVERFREFSRPVEIKAIPIDLHRLLGDVAALQRDLNVESLCAVSPLRIDADADRLRQLFMNLAENTRNILQGRADAKLRVSTRQTEALVRIVFEDNGPGIPLSERERVFEPYRSGRAGGLGLGLALAKGIVLAHGGRIWVAESPLGGAAFHIELPLRASAAARPLPIENA